MAKKRISGSSLSTIVKFFVLVLFLIILVYFFYFSDYSSGLKSAEGRQETVESLLGYVRGSGSWAPVVYMLVYALLTAVLFPGTILTFVGAILFGTWWGTFYTLIGATIGAVASFLIARFLGKDFVDRFVAQKGIVEKLNKQIGKSGFRSILVLRLIPFVPYNALNFGAGLVRVKFWDYFWASLIGMLPGTFVYTYLFAELGKRVLTAGLSFSDFMSAELILPVVLFVLLLIVPLFFKKKK